jgi:hypothetical protein
MPHEVTVINGRRSPTCRHWKGIRFELAHAVTHVGEIDHPGSARAGAVTNFLSNLKAARRAEPAPAPGEYRCRHDRFVP